MPKKANPVDIVIQRRLLWRKRSSRLVLAGDGGWGWEMSRRSCIVRGGRVFMRAILFSTWRVFYLLLANRNLGV